MTCYANTEWDHWWLYTVYYDPLDYPGQYVVRPFQARTALPARDPVYVGESLEEARAAVPRGHVRLPRWQTDDPKIVEVWI